MINRNRTNRNMINRNRTNRNMIKRNRKNKNELNKLINTSGVPIFRKLTSFC